LDGFAGSKFDYFNLGPRRDKETNKPGECVSHYSAMSVRTYSICTATCQKVLAQQMKNVQQKCKTQQTCNENYEKNVYSESPFFLCSSQFCFGMLPLLVPSVCG